MRSLAVVAATLSLGAVGCSSPDTPSHQQADAGSSNGAGAGNGAGSGNGSSGAQNSGGNSAQAGSSNTNQGGDGPSGMAGNSNGGQNGTGGGLCAGTPDAAPTPTTCTAPQGMPAEAAAALAAVNELRSKMGLACMALVTEINTSAQKHCDYYQQNVDDKPCIANAHAEVATCAGFVAANFGDRMTMAGYAGSPRSEVMAFSGDPARAVAQWINSVYHRTPLVSPWLGEMGYGGTPDCDTIDLGLGPKQPDDVTAVYPYPGQADIPLDFDGSHEGPTPPEPPSGWPSASPVHLYVKDFTVTSHDIFASSACVALDHQWLPEKDHYILYPDAPFAKNTEYRVRIAGTRGGQPLVFDWAFTTEN